jgi:hypothetical protein
VLSFLKGNTGKVKLSTALSGFCPIASRPSWPYLNTPPIITTNESLRLSNSIKTIFWAPLLRDGVLGMEPSLERTFEEKRKPNSIKVLRGAQYEF